tara:strand:- start:3 stop:182 length:180 start_codon:yes stop_codon:yes gene_type:complete
LCCANFECHILRNAAIAERDNAISGALNSLIDMGLPIWYSAALHEIYPMLGVIQNPRIK